MAISRPYSALASATLIAALALTGCGATSQKAQEAAPSASATTEQVSLDGIQTLADDYSKAITTKLDAQAIQSQLSEDEKKRFRGVFTGLSSQVKSVSDVENFITGLSPDKRDLLRKVLDSDTFKTSALIDYSNLDENQKLTLDFLNFTLEIGLVTENDEVKLENNTIDLSSLKPDGTQVEIPVKALADSATVPDSFKEFFNHIPAIYVDGHWKINGQKYLQKMVEIKTKF